MKDFTLEQIYLTLFFMRVPAALTHLALIIKSPAQNKAANHYFIQVCWSRETFKICRTSVEDKQCLTNVWAIKTFQTPTNLTLPTIYILWFIFFYFFSVIAHSYKTYCCSKPPQSRWHLLHLNSHSVCLSFTTYSQEVTDRCVGTVEIVMSHWQQPEYFFFILMYSYTV